MKSGSSLSLYIDYNFTSPYGFAAHVALAEKGLPFEVKPLLLHEGEQHTGSYRALSISEKIPTLVHGDFSLSESIAILEYLDEAFAPPEFKAIFPREVRSRARARQVLSYLRTETAILRPERHAKHIFFRSEGLAPLSDRARKDAQRLVHLAVTLGAEGGRNLFGDWSIADAELALALRRLLVFPGDRELVPDAVASYASSQWERPTIRSFLALGRPPAFVDYH